ncbi:hypothetical protein DEU56DRAFT_981844 [Suillus clintonianus]|uniref:uncharacterized protein n=1 Tax=Suillus clintonianus TaxID=1904413 RepID=UPI001B86D674|nr:uncharacterized protein DEU56DRAFT_981844 [Suillus clintonianus]KAG2131825.1 hypothetical protein DEU56DRAFT_981844 [Suillus clintonianus]
MVQLAPRFAALLAFCFLASATPLFSSTITPYASVSAGLVQPTPSQGPNGAHANHTNRDVSVVFYNNTLLVNNPTQGYNGNGTHSNRTARAVAVTNKHPVYIVEPHSHEQAQGQDPITPGVQNTPSLQHDVVVDKNAQVQSSQSPTQSHSKAASAKPTQSKAKRTDDGQYHPNPTYDNGQYHPNPTFNNGQYTPTPTVSPTNTGATTTSPSPTSTATYDDGLYHPNTAYDDGQYHPNTAYDDGQYHPNAALNPVNAAVANPVPTAAPGGLSPLVDTILNSVPGNGNATTSQTDSTAPATTHSSTPATIASSTSATGTATASSATTTTTAGDPTETAVRTVAGTGKRMDDGQYHPDSKLDDGRYHPNPMFNDGKYHASSTGGKRSDDGQYHPDPKLNDGQYHPDPKIDDGKYHPGKHNERRGLTHQDKVRTARKRAVQY